MIKSSLLKKSTGGFNINLERASSNHSLSNFSLVFYGDSNSQRDKHIESNPRHSSHEYSI